MANAYHMDALRKQRVIDRKNEALRRMMNAGSEDFVPEDIVQRAHHQSTTDGLVTTDMGQYNQVRAPLIRFRVNEEGYNNRYRSDPNINPYCDTIYSTIYPGSDNIEYKDTIEKINRRENLSLDKYNITKQINGEFHMQCVAAVPE